MSGVNADEMEIERLDEPDVEVRWPSKPRKPGTWDREQARYWATVNQARRRNLRRLREGVSMSKPEKSRLRGRTEPTIDAEGNECGATLDLPHTPKCTLGLQDATRKAQEAAGATSGRASAASSGDQARESSGTQDRIAREAAEAEAKRQAAEAEDRRLKALAEAEAERLAVIASWATPLDMIASEFPEYLGPSWKPWRIFLKTVWAVPLDPDELEFAQAKTGRSTMPTKPVTRQYVGSGRRGGKSLIPGGLQAVFEAVRPRTWTLAPGEVSTIPVVAADRKQARVIFNYIKGLFAQSIRLSPMVLKSTKDTITLDNRTRIEIHTASYRTTRGYTLCAFHGDESSFWESSETSSNPDTEILNAVRPGLMTSRGPLVITSTPYSRRGVLWQGFKDFFGKDTDAGLYWKASSLDMNPGLDPEEIARAFEEDPEAAAAEYGGEFRTDLSAFFSEDLIREAVIPGRGDLPFNPKYKYYSFCDPSGGSEGGDSFTMAIGHVERDTYVVDAIYETKPPYSTKGVTATYAGNMGMYQVRETEGDHYAAEWPTQEFLDHGIQYRTSEDPKSELYLQALPLFTSGTVEIPEHKRLIGQLRGLERRTARSGKDSIDHAPRGKDDVANAVCGLLALMARKRRRWGHIPPFGYRQNTASGTEWIGGSSLSEGDQTIYEGKCPICGKTNGLLGTEQDILFVLRPHWRDHHPKHGPCPNSIKEIQDYGKDNL